MNRHLYMGLAALAGTIILFVMWIGQYERHAAIERIERYEVPHSRSCGPVTAQCRPASDLADE